ncbi:MFS transporter [Saccharothrix sp. MB29]|nr:MFS transporter [Saccharothrix sp. MB29]
MLFWTGAIPAVLVSTSAATSRTRPRPTSRADQHPQGQLPRSSAPRWAARRSPRSSPPASRRYYTLASWVPTFLKTERGLSVVGTGGYLTLLIGGAFAGYLTGGHLTDRLGRKRTFTLFAVLSALLIVLFTQIPAGGNGLLLLVTFTLGFQHLRPSSAASARTSPSCTRRTCAARAGASPATSAAGWARCSRRRWASWPPRWASAARWCSARSATASPCSPCWACPRRREWNCDDDATPGSAARTPAPPPVSPTATPRPT